MFIAVCIAVSVFVWLIRENAELQRLKQSVTETMESAENKQLQDTLKKIGSKHLPAHQRKLFIPVKFICKSADLSYHNNSRRLDSLTFYLSFQGADCL